MITAVLSYSAAAGVVMELEEFIRSSVLQIMRYDAQVAFGQSRALLVWNRLIMPNGRSIVLERQPGADPEGYAGLEDEVDNHWGTLFKAAILSTLLSVGSEVGTSSSEDELVRAIRRGGADSV